MLAQLSVQNYALISKLELELSSGFSVVTGETGAGKSIILGAIRLVLGERADTKVLFDQELKCIVEAIFNIEAYDLKRLFNDLDLDFWEETIIRREILPSGKSRAFVNDTPVTLVVLKEIAERLVDVHSQHDSHLFKTKPFQFDLIDSYSEIIIQRESYTSRYKQYKKLQAELTQLKEDEAKSKLDQDYFQFQLQELQDAHLVEGEKERLESELQLLQKGEEIGRLIAQGQGILSGNNGITDQLESYLKELSTFKDLGNRYNALYQQLHSAYLEIDDVGRELANLDGTIEHDQETLFEKTERLNLLNALFQKHRVNSDLELIETQNDLELKLQNLDSLSDIIDEQQKAVDHLENELILEAGKLHKARLNGVKGLKIDIEKSLSDLSMRDAEITFKLSEIGELDSYGKSGLSIEFRTNQGSPSELLHKVASGGELSRVMLTLKSILSKRKQLPTVIFDEIDTGVSGEIAGKMGAIMKAMGGQMQVMAITHLPQVAGLGEQHYTVFKESLSNRTMSHIKLLSHDERITEIAKMLSGEKVEASALDTAKSLIGSN